jgi:hypothetical protein
MATTATQVESGAISRPAENLILAGIRYDWIAAILSTLFTAGLFLDGWAHNHDKVDESFFTPWHAVFYGGFLLYGAFLAATLLVNRFRGYEWRRSLPGGYALSLIGAVIFAAGGVGDLVWHTLFGIEENIEALLSPTHLLLGLGMALMVTGPLRAAWLRTGGEGNQLSWRTAGPMLLSIAMVLSIFSFLTQYAHPVVWLVGDEPSTVMEDPPVSFMNANGSLQTRVINLPGQHLSSSSWSPGGMPIMISAGRHPAPQGYLSQPLGISSVLLQTLILMGFVLLAVLRWRLPFGSLAFVLGINALMMSFMNDTFFMILGMALAGLVGDVLYSLLNPSGSRSRLYLFAFLVPASIYTLYFTAVAITSELTWTIHLWAGTIVLAGVASLLLAILIAQNRSSGSENQA